MHVDTGATVSLVSKAFYKERFLRVLVENTDIELKAYAGHKIPMCGQIPVFAQVLKYKHSMDGRTM